ncbi:MAG: hypothetical protein IJB88_02890, partial [Clostridia bacterium]|nr:hypothetical protein [Clostridia bacterium]
AAARPLRGHRGFSPKNGKRSERLQRSQCLLQHRFVSKSKFLKRKTFSKNFHFEPRRDLCGVIGVSPLKTASGVKDSSVASACDDIVSGKTKFFRKVFRCKTKSKSFRKSFIFAILKKKF